MPFRARTPSERRRMLARALYRDEPAARPDWLEEVLLRPGQVAALFQVSRRTVNDWAREGKLDSIITPGGHHRFRARQVRALLESQRIEATTAALHGTHARGGRTAVPDPEMQQGRPMGGPAKSGSTYRS